MSSLPKIQTSAHIFYSGIVQGVGFRFTAQRYASELGLAGWVRNLSDGRVEIIAEGDEKTILQFMQKLEKHFDGSIQDKQLTFSPARQNFKNFQITH